MSVMLSRVPSCLALNCSSLWVSVQVSEPLELTQFRKLSDLHVNGFGIPPDSDSGRRLVKLQHPQLRGCPEPDPALIRRPSAAGPRMHRRAVPPAH